MSGLWSHLLAPGLLETPPVVTALLFGSVVAVASAVVGVFVVVRGQAFLGHALGDMGATGAAGAALVGVGALWGFLVGGLLAGSAVDLGSGSAVNPAGGGAARERDVTTAVVLGAALGLSALFLYLVTAATNRAGATQSILFGSIFTASPALLGPMAGLSALAVALAAVLHRPLLFATVAPEAAQARAVPVRLVSYLFLLAIVITVEQSALVVGALLSTALIIGPAAAAGRIARTMAGATALAVALSLAVVWLGIVLAYDSYAWPPAGRGWPVSFFVTTLVLLTYLVAQAATARRIQRRRPPDTPGGAVE